MNTQTSRHDGATTADRMEAAAWIAKLHGQDRGPELEAGFRRWLNESEAHRAAFEMANELWSDLAAVPKSDHPIRVHFKRKSWRGRGEQPRFRAVLAAAATIASVAVLTTFWFLREPVIATQIGERRTFTLNDGSEVTLNTATRIDLDYNEKQRYLRLQQGEALFKVAKDPNRPFVVSIGDRTVVALGTSFLARRDSGAIVITLIDGKVSVSAPSERAVREQTQSVSEVTLLSPGERLVLVRNEQPLLDRPALEKVTAWQQGQVNLDHTTLTDAITEMNRYSKTQIVLEEKDRGSAPGNIEITGIFRAGEPDEFARAIATTYNLQIREQADAIILSAEN